MSIRTKRAGVVVGIAAAVGLATLASTAFAPTARADDFSDIVAAVEGDFTAGDAEFASAFSHFSGGNAGLGLTDFLIAVGDYTQSAPIRCAQGDVAGTLAEDGTAGIAGVGDDGHPRGVADEDRILPGGNQVHQQSVGHIFSVTLLHCA